MKRWKDPFPPTPQGFHERVEQTLRGLEDTDMKSNRHYRKMTLALAAALIALLAIGAVALVAGNSQFKKTLEDEGADEVAALVQEAHVAGVSEAEAEDFALSVDEIIWEDDDLYFTYSVCVPDDGNEYLVALYNPLLNGEVMSYDAKGWVSSNFFDDRYQSALVLGGTQPTQCGDLLTFKVNPALRSKAANALYLRADFMKANYPFTALGGWDDAFGLTRAAAMPVIWEDIEKEDFDHQISPEERRVLADIQEAAGEDGILTVDEMTGTPHADFAARKEVRMALDASQIEQALYNDVTPREFELNGCKVTVEGFRMTHLGAHIDLRVTAPAGLSEEEGMRLTCNVIDPIMDQKEGNSYRWGLFRADESKLAAVDQGGGSGAGYQPLADGTASYVFNVDLDGIIPLEDIDQLLLMPYRWEHEEGEEIRYEYLRDWAVVLTPLKAPAEIVAPAATLSPDEQAALDRALNGEVMTRVERREAALKWQPGDATVTVYATDGGTYYHVDSRCSGMRGATPRDIADAVESGKKPCPDCIGGPHAQAEWEEGEDISNFPSDSWRPHGGD